MGGYEVVPDLANVYLEDSWVLGFSITPTEFTVRAQLVLLETHPEHQRPRPGEMYCYREGLITFAGFKALDWQASGARPALGPNGEIDFGSIDALVSFPDLHELVGDFGVVRVHGSSVSAKLLEGPSH